MGSKSRIPPCTQEYKAVLVTILTADELHYQAIQVLLVQYHQAISKQAGAKHKHVRVCSSWQKAQVQQITRVYLFCIMFECSFQVVLFLASRLLAF